MRAFAVRLRLEHLQERQFFGLVFRLYAAYVALYAAAELFERDAFQIRFEHQWMNVATAADGRRVAQMRCNHFHSFDQILLRLFFIFTRAYLRQVDGGHERSAPRAKIFGRKFRRGRTLD